LDWSEAGGVASALADPCEAQAISTNMPLKVVVFISLGVALDEAVLVPDWVFICESACGVFWSGVGVVWAAAIPKANDRVSIHIGAFMHNLLVGWLDIGRFLQRADHGRA
jgi:hypothetical protein